MKTYISIGVGLLVALLGTGSIIPQGKVCNQVKSVKGVHLTKLPELTVSGKEGVSGAFGGVLGDAVVIAGGCNFPGVPAAEGGPKVYYDRIYFLHTSQNGHNQWKVAGRLPVKTAYGAAVTMPQGIVCIGGRNDSLSLNKVWLLKWNEEKTGIIAGELASLPVGIDNMTAATDGKKIYVAGGNVEGTSGNACFVLEDMKAREWKKIPDYPGSTRVQPISGVLQSKFYLIGGFQPASEEQECLLSHEVLCYDPETNRWEELPGNNRFVPIFVGSAAVALNDSVLVVEGGVDPEIFKNAVNNPLLQRRAQQNGENETLKKLQHEQETYLTHAPEWYQFNKKLFLYHAIGNRWECAGQADELARAGAVMVKCGTRLFVVNGESKPGIRSAGVYQVEWKD